MQIGLFYQIQVPKPWTPESELNRFWEMIEEVTFAEEMGFKSVWFVEHHFRSEWSHSSAPDITLAALSQRTSKMRLGIAVQLAPIHHPLHTAVQMATLDILSRGRVDLGIGRSGYPYQIGAFGAQLKDARGLMYEAVSIIPRAWTEEEFSYDGQYYKIPPREVVPKPVQKPHPPIWNACSQDDTAQMAGELGLGCLAQTSIGPERAEKLIHIYKEAIQEAQPVMKFIYDRVSGNTVAFCAESRKKAFLRGAELIDWYRYQQRLRDAKVWQGVDASAVPEDYKWHYQRSVADPVRRDETPSLKLIEQGGRFCIGNPDDCIRYIEQYAAIGVDEIMPLFQVGTVTHQEVMNSLRLFGKYVIPHFQEKEQKATATEAIIADN